MQNLKQVTAFFYFTHTYPGTSPSYKRARAYTGSISFQNDKLSISIDNRRNHSSHCNDIITTRVKKEFETFKQTGAEGIFTHIKVATDSLVAKIREATQELKLDFIAKTKKSATRIFEFATERCSLSKEEIEKIYNYKKVPYVAGAGSNSEYWVNNKIYEKMNSDMSKYKSIVKMGYENFEKEQVQHAELHHEGCCGKLAARLDVKGIEEGDVVVKSGCVGQNFEVTIQVGDTTVRAWTIIAEGPIVQAHYRFLVY